VWASIPDAIPDFSDIKGEEAANRRLDIAAAGEVRRPLCGDARLS
jgi:predicted ATPase with chaperone activity